MFQPSPRMTQEEWMAMPAEEWCSLEDSSVEVPIDAPWPLDPFRDSPEGLAWEDFERGLIARRKAEATQYAWLLNARRAAIEAGGFPRDVLERSFQVDAAQALDVSEVAAATLLHHLERVRQWLPASWRAFMAGHADLKAVQTAARMADGLDLATNGEAYDSAVAAAFESVPGTRLKTHLLQVRERLEAESATRRHEEARERRSVQVDLLPDGMAQTVFYGPAVDALAFDDAVQRAAVVVHGQDGETRSVTQLRYDIARDLLLGGVATRVHADGSETNTMTVPSRPVVVPIVTVTIPVLTLMGRGDAGPAWLDGYGPIDTATAVRLAESAPVWTRVLTHPVTGVRLTMEAGQYHPSRALRRWLRLRDATCRWPGCTRPASRSDLDHRDEWHAGGTTEADNLAHLCRKHHLTKSTGNYPSVRDPETERITWTTPGRHRWASDAAPPSEPAPPALLKPSRTNPDLAPCAF